MYLMWNEIVLHGPVTIGELRKTVFNLNSAYLV